MSRVHAQASPSDRASRAVTPPSDLLADASTPSRSQTMLPLTIPAICMSLVAGILADESHIFVRNGGSPSSTPNATVSAHSQVACSINCVAQKEWRCGGFTYLTNGSCLLHQDTGSTTSETAPPPYSMTAPDEEDDNQENQETHPAALFRRRPVDKSGTPLMCYPLETAPSTSGPSADDVPSECPGK